MLKSDPTLKRARLVDVAREANVSVQAASHVMSGNESVRIPESTRIRVREAAVKVGYAPNRLARAIKTGRSGLIALWLPLDRPTPTYFRMLKKISEKAREDGYGLMVVGVDNDAAYKGTGTAPSYWPVDGVIAMDSGKAIQFFRADPQNASTPVSVLAFEEYENADTIAWDVCGGVKAVVQRMLAAGRKDIVHVSPAWILADYPREQRRRGYSEAMTEAGLEPKFISAKIESGESAELAMAEYLRSNPVPEAVVGFLDNLAAGAARAVLASGARIPEDCWIFGVGDGPEAAEFRVPISSLRVPVDALIDQAWSWLLDRIRNTKQAPRVTVLEMEFIERESTQ
jgi:DNA-binding LacI/PurR family transcriptional regulator